MKITILEDYKLKLKHDSQVAIATGKSRFETNWKNRKILWSSLVARLKNPVVTQETYTEYLKLGKPEQDRIKDVGGYVGGTLTGGRRKAGSVVTRQILTLDADFAPVDFFETLELLADYACCVYSTHKHSPEKPRYRLLIPLDREVTPDEYEAIGRKVAEEIGIDYFDDTTYQASRLMYWPSVSSDGDYYYNYLDYAFLSADAVLKRYPDWTDTSYWPESSRAPQIRKKLADKQGDPCLKPGLIGAFCRTYTIPGAIEKFIPDAYIKCGMPNRYTYAGGSTAAGLVVYDDEKFAYSNHATDPASGKLCNAFDLIRLHKYSELDDEVAVDTVTTKLPSYKAMLVFARSDEMVIRELVAEEFGEEDADWASRLLEYDSKGNVKKTIKNVRLILENDSELKEKVYFDQFSMRVLVRRALPWNREAEDRDWSDGDDACLREYLEYKYKISSRDKIYDGLKSYLEKNSIHVVREYFNSLKWDGKERLDTIFTDYLGAANTDYTKAVARKFFCAAVARVYRPGIKFDNMPIVCGGQGIGKSTLFSKMGRIWFSDSLKIDDMKSIKEAGEKTQGHLILEIAEMANVKKVDSETIKAYLSKREDVFRPAYGRNTVRYKRQFVIAGTSNKGDILKDDTGERRFWPIDCGDVPPTLSVFNDLNNDTVDQIWAEAVKSWKAGEKLYLEGELLNDAEEMQRLHKAKTEEEILIIETFDWYQDKSEWIERTSTDIAKIINKSASATGKAMRRIGYSKDSEEYPMRTKRGYALYLSPRRIFSIFGDRGDNGDELVI